METSKNENILMIVSVIIILCVLLLAGYYVFNSNNYLQENSVQRSSDARVLSTPNSATSDSNENADNGSNNTSNNNADTNVTNADENQNNINNSDPNQNENGSVSDNNSSTKTETLQEMSSFSTNIYDNDKNRVYNISLAIEKINGYVIKRGETFSFNNTVGPMDEAHGFKKAVGFDSNGKKISMAGGRNVSNK